jgi:hypothetical protein
MTLGSSFRFVLALAAGAMALSSPPIAAEDGAPNLGALRCPPARWLTAKSTMIGAWTLTGSEGFIPGTCRPAPASLTRTADPQSPDSFGLMVECQSDGSLRFGVLARQSSPRPAPMEVTLRGNSAVGWFSGLGAAVVWIEGDASEFLSRASPEGETLRIELNDGGTRTSGLVAMDGFNEAAALLRSECPNPSPPAPQKSTPEPFERNWG